MPKDPRRNWDRLERVETSKPNKYNDFPLEGFESSSLAPSGIDIFMPGSWSSSVKRFWKNNGKRRSGFSNGASTGNHGKTLKNTQYSICRDWQVLLKLKNTPRFYRVWNELNDRRCSTVVCSKLSYLSFDTRNFVKNERKHSACKSQEYWQWRKMKCVN